LRGKKKAESKKRKAESRKQKAKSKKQKAKKGRRKAKAEGLRSNRCPKPPADENQAFCFSF